MYNMGDTVSVSYIKITANNVHHCLSCLLLHVYVNISHSEWNVNSKLFKI